jgi:hypothetical protein
LACRNTRPRICDNVAAENGMTQSGFLPEDAGGPDSEGCGAAGSEEPSGALGASEPKF